MDIQEALTQGHSTEIRNEIIAYVGSNPTRMKELMDCYFSDNLRLNQRASWPLNFIARKYPEQMEPYHEQMMDAMENPLHNAVLRNTVRIYEDIDIPESIEGRLFEKCYEYVADPKMATAVRAFSLTILEKLIIKFPELQNEVIELIKEQVPHGSAGFKNRGKKILRRLGVGK
jgi:hypothetical protein